MSKSAANHHLSRPIGSARRTELKVQVNEESSEIDEVNNSAHPPPSQEQRGFRWAFRMSERRALLLVADAVLVNLCVILALWAWTIGYLPFTREFLIGELYWFPFLTALWLFSAVLNGLYDTTVTARLRNSARALTQVVALLLGAYLFIYFLSSPGELPRRFVFYFIGMSFVALGIWRFVYTVYLGRAPFQRRAILVGSDTASSSAAQTVRTLSNPHYNVVGFVNEQVLQRPDLSENEGMAPLGSMEDLPQLARMMGASEVIVTSIEQPNERLVRSLVDCQEQGVQVTPLPVVYEEITGRIPLDLVARGWLSVLPMSHAGTGVIFPLFKRTVDIVLAVMGLSVLLLLLPFVALGIRLDSPGPIFYPQDRVGKGGRRFRAYKFRSMEVQPDDVEQPLWTEHGDSRVTRVGRLLRSTHVDEFPQFLNILKGDMSSVGPRPERIELADQFDKAIPFYRLRHSVRPGMAGWALIKQGNTSSVQDAWRKLEYDLYYIKHQSIWLDLLILLKTFVDAVTFRGR